MFRSRGFTLIEITVAVGIFMAAAVLLSGMDSNYFRDNAFRAERDALVVVLQTARMDAMNNLHERSHGVALRPADHPNAYVMFEGPSYAASDPSSREVATAKYDAEIAIDAPSEIVFCQLSGAAARGIAPGTRCDDPRNYYDGAIVMTDAARRRALTIAVNYEGAIRW